ASSGKVSVGGHDIVRDWRAARSMIGLVPQELTSNAFESVWATVSFSRGLFNKPADAGRMEQVLKDLSLWDRKDSKIMTLSGGMNWLYTSNLLFRRFPARSLRTGFC